MHVRTCVCHERTLLECKKVMVLDLDVMVRHWMHAFYILCSPNNYDHDCMSSIHASVIRFDATVGRSVNRRAYENGVAPGCI